MIILDTNIVSETMKPMPDSGVMDWLNMQDMASLWLTSITVAELRFGVANLAEGKNRTQLGERIETLVWNAFDGRVKDFDVPATVFLADRAAAARRIGRKVEFADAAIAAIALTHGFAVATRDTRPFLDMGCDVINPWDT